MNYIQETDEHSRMLVPSGVGNSSMILNKYHSNKRSKVNIGPKNVFYNKFKLTSKHPKKLLCPVKKQDLVALTSSKNYNQESTKNLFLSKTNLKNKTIYSAAKLIREYKPTNSEYLDGKTKNDINDLRNLFLKNSPHSRLPQISVDFQKSNHSLSLEAGKSIKCQIKKRASKRSLSTRDDDIDDNKIEYKKSSQEIKLPNNFFVPFSNPNTIKSKLIDIYDIKQAPYK